MSKCFIALMRFSERTFHNSNIKYSIASLKLAVDCNVCVILDERKICQRIANSRSDIDNALQTERPGGWLC